MAKKMPTRIPSMISVDPEIRAGQPVLTGTRVPICLILGELGDGNSLPKIACDMDLDLSKLKSLLNEIALKYERRPDDYVS